MRALLRWAVALAALAAFLAGTAYIYLNYFFDLDRYRGDLAALLSEKTGRQVTIGAPLHFAFAPEPALSLGKVEATGPSLHARARRLQLGFVAARPWPPVIALRRLRVEGLRLALSPDRPRALAWPATSPLTLGPVTLAPAPALRLTLRQTRIELSLAGRTWVLRGLDADLRLDAAAPSPTARGRLRAAALDTPYGSLHRPRAGLDASGGHVEAHDITAGLYSGDYRGDLTLDTGRPLSIRLRFSLAGFDVAAMLNRLSGASPLSGRADARGELSWRSLPGRSWAAGLDGRLRLEGSDLRLHDIDADDLLDRFKKSQRLDLVDIGAMALLGPLGAGLTKGRELVGLAAGGKKGDETTIERVVGIWEVEHGVARAVDVAFATPRHLLALKGRVDLAAGRYMNTAVALVDRRGCALAVQKIRGDLKKPEIEKPDILSTLIGPVKNTLKLPLKILGTDTCKPFYRGTLLGNTERSGNKL